VEGEHVADSVSRRPAERHHKRACVRLASAAVVGPSGVAAAR
jgi:hypothetical protein